MTKAKLAESATIFADFMDRFPQGDFTDQALFYAGECCHLTNQTEQAASYHERLVAEFPESPQRPDALYALAVAAQDAQQNDRAAELFKSFLSEYSEHELRPEMALRYGEVLLATAQFDAAEEVVRGGGDGSGFSTRGSRRHASGACRESSGRLFGGSRRV